MGQLTRSRLACAMAALFWLGCGGGMRVSIRSSASAISSVDAEERLSLGSTHANAGADPDEEIERLMRLSRLAERLEQRDDALLATASALRLAQGMAYAHPSDASRERRGSVERYAVGVFDRLGDARSVLALAESAGEALPQDVLLRALQVHVEGLPLTREVWERLDTRGRAHAEWAGRRPLGIGLVSLSDVRALGTSGVALAEQRALDLASAADLEGLRAALSSLAELDPRNPMVLASAAMERELASGVLRDAELLYACVGAPANAQTGSAIPRVLLGLEGAPESHSLPITLALLLHWADAPGDARALAARHLDAPDADVAFLAMGLVGLSDLAVGDPSAFEAFVAAHSEVRHSASWVAQAVSFENRETPNHAVSALARRLRRDLGLHSSAAFQQVAMDAEASRDLRQSALDELLRHDPYRTTVIASCIADALSTEGCRARVAAIDTLIDSGATDPALFDALGQAASPSFFYDVEEPWVDAMQRAAAAWLDGRRDTADGYTEAWVFARVSTALALGDTAGAQSLLDERGALLPRAYRAGANMALAAVAEAEPFYGITPMEMPLLHPLGASASFGETDYGCFFVNDETDPETRERCLRFLARLTVAAPELRAVAEAIIGTSFGMAVDLPNLAAVAGRAAPAGRERALIEALQAERQGDAGTAAERFLRLTLAEPELPMVDRRYLHYAVLAGSSLTAIADTLGSSQFHDTAGRDVARVVRLAGVTDAELLARLYDLDPLAFADLGDAALQHRHFVVNHANAIVGALRETPQPAFRSVLARRFMPLMRLVDGVIDARLLRAQLALLAADPEEARAAADRPFRGPGDSFPLPEVSDIRDLIAAGSAVSRELMNHILFTRPAGSRRTAEAVAAFLLPLENLAGTNPLLMPLLCGEEVRAGNVTAALAACGPLHARAPSPITWARMSAPLALADGPVGLDPDAFFRSAIEHTEGPTLGLVSWNDALRLTRAGRTDESARAALVAERAGFVAGAPANWELAQVRVRGVELRARTHRSRSDQVYLSLAQGDGDLAWFYARAGMRSHEGESNEALGSDPAYASFCFASDLAFWAQRDIEAGRIDQETLATWDRLRRAGFEGDELDSLLVRFPEADVVRLAEGVRNSDAGRHREAYDAIRPLLSDSPRASLAVLFRRSIGLASSRGEADETVARLRGLFPSDPRLLDAEAAILPEALSGSDALDAFLATVDDADFALLQPEVRVDPNGHASAAFPAASSPLPTFFGAQMGSTRLLAGAEPRLAHCEGSACLDSILPSFDAMGMSTVWRSEVTTQAGPGARAFLSGPGGAALFTVIPRGSVLFVLGVIGSPEQIAVRLRTFAMLERSFSPIDVAVPNGWAATLAGEAPTEEVLPVARRIEALRALAAAPADLPSTECPIRPVLDGITAPEAREALVRALYLGRGEANQRLALLRCVDVNASGHAALGLAATLDPSASAHALGRTMLSHDGAAARTIVEQLLEVEAGRAHAGVAHRDSALPPFAGVELIIALPDDARRTLTSGLWARGTPASRALAVVAEEVEPHSLDHALVRETLRAGPAPEAVTAADVLYGSEDAADLDAARSRLDALVTPVDEPSRVLALRLVWELARRLDRNDLARFSAVAERLRETMPTASNTRLYEWSAERVDHEVAVLRASLERNPSDLPEEVESSLEIYRGMRRVATRRRTSPRVAAALATEPLARVLPGAHWSYVRVPSPSLLIATLESMYRRLESSSASDGALARQSLQFMLEQANAALLAPDGGLDLSRPIECATADRFPRSWVCAAYVSDPDRVRDLLAERRYGTNSGAWLAVEAARQARSLPIAAGGMPYELAEMLSEEPAPAPPSAGAIVLRERARTEVDLDGVRVLRYATFVSREGEDTGTDTEHYLFTGDRLVMFGLEETARELLAEPLPLGRSLAGQPRFRALTEGWTDGSVLQLVNVGFRHRMLPEPLPAGDMGLELSAWDEGLVGRIRMPFSETTTGVEDLLARLPPEALSSMSFVPDPDREVPEARTEAPAADDWRGYLLGHANRFALGWYGAGPAAASTPLSRVWGAWTLVLGTTDALSRELSSWSLLPGEGATTRRDGLVFGRSGGTLVVSTDERAVTTALATPASRASATIMGSAHLDGTRTAEVARALSDGLRRDDPRRDQLELLAAILGLAREVSFEARADPRHRELVITARVTPNLGPPGDNHALIDELLRNARNAVTLPRALSGTDLRGTLRLTVNTAEPEVVARRGFGGHPRLSTEVRDEHTLVLTLRPSDSTPVTLTDAQRATLLASTRAIRADAETILALARELAPTGTSPADAARAIVTWVHDNIRYELTAEELDAPTVLDTRRGDCSELARLTTALLRAVGIPAEIREGFLVVGAEMGAHAWVAYYDGNGFREIDPTAGRADVDSGYVPSSVLTVMGLAAIGDLQITEVVNVP